MPKQAPNQGAGNIRRWYFLAMLIVVLTGVSPLPADTASSPGACRIPAGVLETERARVSHLSGAAVQQPVETVTASRSERSPGGPHDYYSEGDYWWPDPENPGGPYIRRDGESNPDNFNDHREALLGMSDAVGTLASAWLLEGERVYADRLAAHLDAWFIAKDTRMNPWLLHAQAIKGRSTGRSIGLIDTVHLSEVALAVHLLNERGALPQNIVEGTVAWFAGYLDWLNTHPFGLKEKFHPNNHSVAWSLQAASFATLTGNTELLAEIRERFETVYIGEMMATDGSFPAETARTKPYGYSLFMFDLLAGIAALASDDEASTWLTDRGEGRSVRNMYAFIVPYIEHKDRWPFEPDVQYWNDWPAQHAALVLGAMAYDEPGWIALWRQLDTRREVFEVMRNLPLRNVLLWLPGDCLDSPL